MMGAAGKGMQAELEGDMHSWLWGYKETRPLFSKGQAESLHTRMFEVCFICCFTVLHVIKKENPDFIQGQILHSSLSHNSYLKSD